jgi:hypothetical protein
MKLRLLYLLAAVLTLSSCETEVELTAAEYAETTVVYGLIDLSASKQVFRINKTFLGEGSAFDMALVADSSEYDIADVMTYV